MCNARSYGPTMALSALVIAMLLQSAIAREGEAPAEPGAEQTSASGAPGSKPSLPNTARQEPRTPELPRSTPERQGVSSARVLDFIEAADDVDAMHSFMLVRHGHVVAEAWWAPFDAQTPHMLYSLSKSFTSTAVGLAVAEGKISVDDEVLKLFPDLAPPQPSDNLRAMRVSDLLRMNTGHTSEPKLGYLGEDPADNAPWAKKFLAHPVTYKPGTHFLYNTPATYMQSAIVTKVTGESVLDYLKPRLLEPLGFENPRWLADPQGVNMGGFGFEARTEELARFGQLYLQKGEWQGKQLLPAAWVQRATSLQTSNGSNPKSDWDQGYGYQFWRSRHGAFRGDGAFGQYCVVLPEQDAVIVITSGVRDMQGVLNLVWNKLLPAFDRDPLPEEPAAVNKLTATLADLKVKLPAGRADADLAAKVADKWYTVAKNDRGIDAVAIDFNAQPITLKLRTSAGEQLTPIGSGEWLKSADGYSAGIDRFLSAPKQPQMAAAGAWSADDAYTIKLIARETPFYATLTFRFADDGLQLDTEYNANFGPTKLAQLNGELEKQ